MVSKLLRRIKKYFIAIYNIIWFTIYTDNAAPLKSDYSEDSIWKGIVTFTNENRSIEYNFFLKEFGKENEFKWVGGVYTGNAIVGIANGAVSCMVLDLKKNQLSNIGSLNVGDFKWSGGCFFNGTVYGFPRKSNNLMVFPISDGLPPDEISLEISYSKEHHYGGVCTKDGIIYQPPRNSNTILKTDLKNNKTKEISISKDRRKFRYCGSIIHPNGLIYMFPEYMEKVMVINPKTDKVYFIGKIFSSMTFDACIGYDGNIYGFSAYSNGILKIDVNKNTANMLFDDKKFGCYGSILGANGNVIGVPGDGNQIYEYNIKENCVKVIASLEEKGPAKCAGSAVSDDGTIYCIPALGNKIYMLKPGESIKIPGELLQSSYFNGNY